MKQTEKISIICQANSLIFLVFANQACLAQTPAQPSTAVSRSGQVRQLKPYVFNIPGLHYADDIPTNFPAPAYPSNVVRKRFINTTKGAPGATATIHTKDKVAVVFDWYKEAFKKDGWTYKTPSAQAAGKLSKSVPLFLINAKKDRNVICLSCHTDKKTGGTQVNLSWCKDKK